MLYFIIPAFLFSIILEFIGREEDERKRGDGDSSEE